MSYWRLAPFRFTGRGWKLRSLSHSMIGAVVLYIEGANRTSLKFSKAKGAGDTDFRGSGSIGLQRMPSAVRLLQLGFARCGPRMALLVRLHAVERFFKLGHQRRLARLEAVAAHDAPEIIAIRSLVPVVHGHHIFGRPTRDQNDDVCF